MLCLIRYTMQLVSPYYSQAHVSFSCVSEHGPCCPLKHSCDRQSVQRYKKQIQRQEIDEFDGKRMLGETPGREYYTCTVSSSDTRCFYLLQDIKDHCKKALSNVGADDDVCDVSRQSRDGRCRAKYYTQRLRSERL